MVSTLAVMDNPHEKSGRSVVLTLSRLKVLGWAHSFLFRLAIHVFTVLDAEDRECRLVKCIDNAVVRDAIATTPF